MVEKVCALQNPFAHYNLNCSVCVVNASFFVKLVFTKFEHLELSDFTIKLRTVAAGIDQLDCLNNTINVLRRKNRHIHQITLR